MGLGHQLCAHRLQCKLASAFGKKVQMFTPPDGEWMRWSPCLSGATGSQTCNGLNLDLSSSEADVEGGRFLYEGFQKLKAGSGLPAEDSVAVPPEPSEHANNGIKVDKLGSKL